MCLNTANEVECEFAKWRLEVGHRHHTDPSDDITLPNHFHCPENTVQSLINTIYPGVSATQQPDQYYADHTILCSQNDDVHELNKKILDSFSGDEKTYFSTDSISTGEGNGDQGDLMYSVEYLNTIQCSGLPLAKLILKIGCPVIVLCNIDPSHASEKGHLALAVFRCFSCLRGS